MRNENEGDAMKDVNDKQTIDGFADLLRDLDEHPPEPEDAPPVRPGVALSDLAKLLDHVALKSGLKRPVGRPPKGSKALTPAEKQKAYRDRKRAEKQAEADRLAAIKNGEPVTSKIIDLDTNFSDLYQQTRGKPGA
jgi:hypothetical protein